MIDELHKFVEKTNICFVTNEIRMNTDGMKREYTRPVVECHHTLFNLVKKLPASSCFTVHIRRTTIEITSC